ncbi:pyridoxal-dependent decarboxylase [Lachnoclostridium sp. Marseille-P6806]|uniref:pyridoxal-dependent decarboxylase n=1 Tax=Lachnoclostridium sp. Marseille-P6806 TaxID=2364793 RepID=UPI00102F2FC1|nr:pyridoxal-dependent decarboxylase [Lachnoclostridium sp. Marseille-P6806]
MKTPYYYISETVLDEDVAVLRQLLRTHWKNAAVGYSVKTNSLPWLLSHLKGQGLRAEIVSDFEYEIARAAGFAPSQMIYNGPIKDAAVSDAILRAGGLVNLDSEKEIAHLENSSPVGADAPVRRVGLRVNCDMHRLVPGETSSGEETSRFGYCYEDGGLADVIARLRKLPDVEICGLHLHCTTHTRSVAGFRALARFAGELRDAFGLTLSYVDLGGGFWGGVPGRPDFRDYIPAIASELSRFFNPEATTLILEPGVSLVSRCSSFVTTVREVKRLRGEVFAVTDGGRVHLNPQVTRRRYPHHTVYLDHDREIVPRQMICGYTCMEYDRLFEETDAPALRPGDRVVYDLAGGYTLCLAPQFIQGLPAVYIGKADGSVLTAREAWGAAEYLQKCRFETL